LVQGRFVLTTDTGVRAVSRGGALCESHPEYVDDIAQELQDAPQTLALLRR
jgi:hypothetical protein